MGEVMPLTPEDVSNKRFTPVRLREGYDMGEVDQFLDEVEAELARLTKENDDLRSKLAAAQVRWRHAPTAPQPVVEEKARAGARAGAASPARRRPCRPSPRPRSRRSGSRPCRRRPTPRPACSRSRRATPTSWSRTPRTRPTRSSARPGPRPSASTSESKAKADRLEADARTRAQMLDSETAERRRQMFGDLEKERDKLNGEVENLRSFEREYRSRLKSYFSQQLESLGVGSEPGRRPATSQPAPKRLRSILGEDDA